MDIGRKLQLGGLAGVLLTATALAQAAPKNAPPQTKKETPQTVADESSQNIWDSDIERVSREIGKLRLKLKVKELEGQALEAYKKGDYDAVRAMVPEILKLDPEAIDASEHLAAAEWMRGDKKALERYDQAIESRKKWLERHSSPEEQRDGIKHLAVLFGNRGAARMMNDPQGAIEDYDEALKNKTPLAAMIMWEKSEALAMGLHRYEEAAKLYAAAVAKDPGLKARGNVKFPDPTARNLCQVLAANGQNIQACN